MRTCGDVASPQQLGISYTLTASLRAGISYTLTASLRAGSSYKLTASLRAGIAYTLTASLRAGSSYKLTASLRATYSTCGDVASPQQLGIAYRQRAPLAALSYITHVS